MDGDALGIIRHRLAPNSLLGFLRFRLGGDVGRLVFLDVFFAGLAGARGNVGGGGVGEEDARGGEEAPRGRAEGEHGGGCGGMSRRLRLR